MKIRIAFKKPNYIPEERNYPSFLRAKTTNTVEQINVRRTNYINSLFNDNLTVNGSSANIRYLSWKNIFISLKINDVLTIDVLQKASFIEITFDDLQVKYYFVEDYEWSQKDIITLELKLEPWITFWHLIDWEIQSAYVKRSHQDRFIYDNGLKINYNRLNDNLNNFNNHYLKTVCGINYKTYREPVVDGTDSNFLLESLINKANKTIYQNALIKIFCEKFEFMFIAYVVQKGGTVDKPFPIYSNFDNGIPIGCFLCPIFLGNENFENILVSGDGHLSSDDMEKNRYETLANLGNGYVVSICAIPFFPSTLAFFSREKPFISLTKNTIVGSDGNDSYVWSFDDTIETNTSQYNLKVKDKESTDLLNEHLNFWKHLTNKKLFSYPTLPLGGQDEYYYLNEPKLISEPYTKVEFVSVDKSIELDIQYLFNPLIYKIETKDGVSTTSYFPTLTFNLNYTLAPHIFSFTLGFNRSNINEDDVDGFMTYQNEIGMQYQKDLQLISSSSAYSNFLTNHKNSYGVSLAQGKIGVQHAEANAATSGFSALSKLLHGDIGGAASAGINAGFGVKSAKLNLKAIQASTKDLARQPRSLNDSSTSETYGDLSLSNFQQFRKDDDSNKKLLFGHFKFYQIPENQLKIISWYYHLHGYLWEQQDIIGNYDYFISRVIFNYFEINMISTAIDKTSGFIKPVIDWFNDLFDQGVRLWHHVNNDLNKPKINNYMTENWEVALLPEPDEVS